jgi:uncharacterized protein YkwD
MFNAVSRRQPRHVMARAMALSGTALLAAALLAWAPQPTTGWVQSSAEATLWQLLNGDRVNNGLAPLTQHSTLVSLARWRSQDMVARDYFNHTILGTSYQVYHWFDSNHMSWVSGGENIGWNNGYSDTDSPVQINQGFMNSLGHRANILTPNWTHGGVGAYGADGVTWGGQVRNMRMYTELFIQLKSTPPPPIPAPTKPPPPPPPPTPTPTAQPSTAPTATPHQAPLETVAPESPTPSPSPGQASRTAAPSLIAAALGTIHAVVGDAGPGAAGRPVVASSLRVETPAAAQRGIFETVIGSLLSFLLG